MSRIDDILGFWLEETPSKYWYQPGEGIDERIRALFAADWGRAVTGQLAGWTGTPRGALAYIILTDQFPRNMFRGRALSFASDDLGLAAARAAVDAGHDLAFPMPARQFFYLPFTHSENADDQATCVRLIEERVPEPEHILHSRAHAKVIADFGRFPFRNAALGRVTTPGEQAFLDAGAYPGLVSRMRESHAPDA
jgi:uncharacterized protein (DUF924 family)